jgi:LysM repeat protein
MGLVTFVLTIALSGILARAATQMAAVSVSAEPRVAAAESAAYPAWTVAPSDTLWSIAQATAPGADPRATVEVLRALNGLADDHVLQVGEVLQIPAR